MERLYQIYPISSKFESFYTMILSSSNPLNSSTVRVWQVPPILKDYFLNCSKFLEGTTRVRQSSLTNRIRNVSGERTLRRFNRMKRMLENESTLERIESSSIAGKSVGTFFLIFNTFLRGEEFCKFAIENSRSRDVAIQRDTNRSLCNSIFLRIF